MAAKSKPHLRVVKGGQELTFKSTDPGPGTFECPMCKAEGRQSGTLMQMRMGSTTLKNRIFPGKLGQKLYCPICFALGIPGLFRERGLVAVKVGTQWEKVGTDTNPQ